MPAEDLNKGENLFYRDQASKYADDNIIIYYTYWAISREDDYVFLFFVIFATVYNYKLLQLVDISACKRLSDNFIKEKSISHLPVDKSRKCVRTFY